MSRLHFNPENIALSRLGIEYQTIIYLAVIYGRVGHVHIDRATVDKLEFLLSNEIDDSGPDVLITAADIGTIDFKLNARLVNLSITNSSKINYIYFGFCYIENINIGSSVVGCLQLRLDDFRFDEFNLSGKRQEMHVNELFIEDGLISEGVKKKLSTFRCENITVSRISFRSFTNQGNVFFSRVSYSAHRHFLFLHPAMDTSQQNSNVIMDKSRSSFSIEECDLGKLNFVACDFSKMKMELIGSKINEIYLSGTEMPLDLIGSYKDRQLGYGQLKKVYDNRGDSVKTQEYLSKELDAHYNCVKAQKDDANYQELWTLRLNKWSNNFGTDWLLALKGILFISLPIYIIYIWSLNHFPEIVEPNGKQLSNVIDAAALFFEFLSPIHKSEFIADKLGRTSTATSWVLEFLGRLVNGYLIYQFIQAFRKYGKK